MLEWTSLPPEIGEEIVALACGHIELPIELLPGVNALPQNFFGGHQDENGLAPTHYASPPHRELPRVSNNDRSVLTQVSRQWAECVRKRRFYAQQIKSYEKLDAVLAHLQDEQRGSLPLPFGSLVRRLDVAWKDTMNMDTAAAYTTLTHMNEILGEDAGSLVTLWQRALSDGATQLKYYRENYSTHVRIRPHTACLQNPR